MNKFFVNEIGGIHGNVLPTGKGRISFVYLAEPNPKYAPPKYSFTLAFNAEDDEANALQLNAIKTMCSEMAQQYAVENLAKYKKALKNDKLTDKELLKIKVDHWNANRPVFRDGDSTEVAEFKNCRLIVVKRKAEEIKDVMFLGLERQEFKAGMLCRAVVSPYLDKDGFSYKLHTLKLIRDDGTRYSAAPTGASLLQGLDDAAEQASSYADSEGDDIIAI